MQIFLSIIVNLIILAIVLPLFYVFIISKARERLEKETIKKVEDELVALVHEFNRSAISNVSLLEDAILRVRREYADIVNKENSKNSKTFINDRNLKEEIERDIEATKKEIEKSEFDKIERDTKKINNLPRSNFSNAERKQTINIVVDDNIESSVNASVDSGAMTKAQIESTLKKIKQNISINQEKKVHPDNTSIETLKYKGKKSREDIEQVDKTDNNEVDKNTVIVSLYKKGLSAEDIAIETNSSIAEVELVLDMEIRDN